MLGNDWIDLQPNVTQNTPNDNEGNNPNKRRPAPAPPTEEQQDEDEKKMAEIPKSYEGDLCFREVISFEEQSGLTCVRQRKCVPNVCGHEKQS